MPTLQVFLIGAAVFAFDRLTKAAAEAHLSSIGSYPVVPDIFHLTLVHNTGAAFGLFKNGTFLLALVTILCVGAIFALLNNSRWFSKFFSGPLDGWFLAAFGLIVGGGCGNLLDRLRYSYVIDFLDFRIWPVFNLADSAITAGGIILFFKICFPPRKAVA
ncbi:MAG: signal peptidase II [Candidatus Omnitrophota bacterium]